MAKAATTRDRPRWKRRLAAGGAAAIVLLVMVILAPTFVNLGLGQESIRRAIQRRVEPDVEFGDLRVGWFGSQRLEHLTLTRDDGREIAKLDLRVDRGLLGLALGVGRIHVAVAGVLRTALRPDGSLGLGDDLAPRPRGGAAAGRPAPPMSGVPAGTLLLEGLRVELHDEVRDEALTLESLTGSVRYAPGGLVDVELSSPTSSRGEPGTISVAAKLHGLVHERGHFTPWAASGDVEIALARVRVPMTARDITLRSARVSAVSPSLRDRLTIEVAAEAVIDGGLPGSAKGKIIALSPVDEEGYVDVSLDRLAGRITAERVPTAPLQLLLPAGTPLRLDRDLGATIDLDASFTDRVTVTLRSDAVRLETSGAIDRATGRVSGDTMHLVASLAPELIDAFTGIIVADAVAAEIALDSFSMPRDAAAAAFHGVVSLPEPVSIQVPGSSASVPVGPARIVVTSEGIRRGLHLDGTARLAGAESVVDLELAGLVASGDGEAPPAWPLRLDPRGALTMRALDPAIAARLFPDHEGLIAAVADGPVDVTIRSERREGRLAASIVVAGPGIDFRGDAARDGQSLTLGPVQGRMKLTPDLAGALQQGLAAPLTMIGEAMVFIETDPAVLTAAPGGPETPGLVLPSSVSGRVSIVDLTLDAGKPLAEPIMVSRFSTTLRLDRGAAPAIVADGTAQLRTVSTGQAIGSLRFEGKAIRGDAPSESVKLELRDLSVIGIERTLGWRIGGLSDWLGPGGWGTLELTRSPAALEMTIAPAFHRLSGRAQVTVDEHTISLVAERATATIDRELIERRMSHAPAPVAVRADVPVSLAVRFRAPRTIFADGATFDPAAVLVDAELSVGPMGLTDRSGGTATLRSAVLKLASENLSEGLTVVLTAQVEQPGGRNGTLRVDGGLVGLVKRNALTLEGAGLDLAVEARHVPTAIVDGLCAWNGLLVAAMGDRFEGEAGANRLWLGRGTVGLKVRSPSATLDGHASGSRVEGESGGAALVIASTAPLEATLELTPALRERLLSRIHPLLADVRTVEQRPKMTVTAASVPLDGDPARLDADLLVTVGKVEFDSGSLGLALLAAAHATNAATFPGEIEPIKATIRKGILKYERFAVRLDKYTLMYSGTIDLVAGTVDLRTEVPLAGLAQSVKELRDYADKIIVPLVTRGRFGALRTDIDPEFDLAGAAVEAGFRGAIGDLLKSVTKDTGLPINDIFDGIFGGKKK